MAAQDDHTLARTPLHGMHVRLAAKMAGFAGYDMPINYPSGILQEHLHTRAAAGLFDVSHMGQAVLSGPRAAARIEMLVPGDIQTLEPGRIRYTQFLNDQGGILDDLMVTRFDDETFFLVVNAGCKAQDFAHIAAHLPDLRLDILADRALIALQGPKAAAVLEKFLPGISGMDFMTMRTIETPNGRFHVSRSGYTGEDGYEVSVPEACAETFATQLLGEPEVKPIGLGARDSLRLEAGLCLYGHDIDTATTPAEAALLWSISKRRRTEGGFPGAAIVQKQIAEGAPRKRVGILPEGRAPAREGAAIHLTDGTPIGKVTSGGFAPSLNAPVAMGYVATAHSAIGTRVHLIVRGKALPAVIATMPFVPNNFRRGPARA